MIRPLARPLLAAAPLLLTAAPALAGAGSSTDREAFR